MDPPILPTGSNLLTPFIGAVTLARPESLQHFNAGGNWAALPKMYRAELLLCLSRLAKEVKAARLRFASGEELRTLCASEFSTTLPAAPQTALGKVTFTRASGLGGVLAKPGDTFVRKADPNARPLPIAAATYDVSSTVYAPAAGQSQSIDVPLVAKNPGATGNVPAFTNYVDTSIQPQAAVFDPGFRVTACEAAGGSSGISDPVLVAAAQAYAQGQFGPTDAAIVASILRSQAARRTAILEASGTVPYDQAFAADESWASSVRFTAQLAQSFITDFQGFGCRVFFGAVVNRGIGLSATVALKSTDDLAFTDDIAANVTLAAHRYFDDRPDWYVWQAQALAAALTTADPRIQECTGAVVTDSVTGGSLAEPVDPHQNTGPTLTLTHYAIVARNVALSFVPPT
jgi:hypothetical protein